MQILNDFFQKNKKINVNVDNDGILSSIVLKKLYDCEIYGFNNNDKIIIHEKDTKYEDLTYIDICIGYPTIKSLDQHCVSVSEKHNNMLKENTNKINPNVEFDIVWENYTNKFPFSTLIYILTKADGEGKDLSFIDLKRPITSKFTLADMIWQTDSSCENYIKYNRNATNWLERLRTLSNGGKFTDELIHHLTNKMPSNKDEMALLNLQIGVWYRENFHCTNNHGGIRDGYIKEDGKVSDDLIKYLNTVGMLFGVNMQEIKDKEFIKTTFKSKRLNFDEIKDRFDSTKLFSYALIYGLSKKGLPNISLTYD